MHRMFQLVLLAARMVEESLPEGDLGSSLEVLLLDSQGLGWAVEEDLGNLRV